MPGKEIVDLSLLEPVVTVIGSGILTILGIGAEWNGIQHLLQNDITVGAWLAFVGSIVLYLGVIELGWNEVLS